MDHVTADVVKTYYELKSAMENAYNEFNRHTNLNTHAAYQIALTNFQDFCVTQCAKLVGDTQFASSMEVN